jgi:hypothetical protein
VVERFFQVPLDYSNPSGEKIVIFARQSIPISKAKTKADEEKLPFGAKSTTSYGHSLTLLIRDLQWYTYKVCKLV